MDIGTTYSAAAMVLNGKFQSPIIISNESSEEVIPSIIHITESKEIVLGKSAEKFKKRDPANTYYDTKRTIGVKLNLKYFYLQFEYKILNVKYTVLHQ